MVTGTALLVASLVVSVAGAAVGAITAARAAKKQAKAQKEARAISSAQRKNEANLARRKQIRAAMVTQARIEQSAETSGVGGASGVTAATSVLGANLGANFSQQGGRVAAAAGISTQQGRIASATQAAQRGAAIGSFISAIGGAMGSASGFVGGAPVGNKPFMGTGQGTGLIGPQFGSVGGGNRGGV